MTQCYIVLQTVITIIALIGLSLSFQILIQKAGSFFFIELFMIIFQGSLGLHFSIKSLEKPSEKYATYLVYLPFILFIEGGVLATLGFILMIVAMFMKREFWKFSTK